jgi:hypothetical protein
MIRTSVSLDKTISFLNDLLITDPLAIHALFANRVSCNEALSNHPTVQVRKTDTGYLVGILGLINGLFGSYSDDHYGPLCMVVANDGTTILRFERTRP